MWKELLVVQAFILIAISCNESLSSESKQPVISTADNNSVECSSTNFDYSDSKIVDIRHCENMSSDVLKNLTDFLHQSPEYFVVMIGMDVMDENFESWIKSGLEDSLSRPIILKIYSTSEDIENNFLIDKGVSNATLAYAKDFMTKVMSSYKFFEDNPTIFKDVMKHNCSICIRLAYLVDDRFMKNFTITDDEFEALSCDVACFKSLLDLPYNFNFVGSCDQVYKTVFDSFIDKLRESSGTAAEISQNYSIDDFLLDFEIELPLSGITALAWKESEHQIFEFLIRNDFLFPANFLKSRKMEYKDGTEYDRFVNSLESYLVDLVGFHRDIQHGNIEQVKEFMANHQHLAFARNLDNKSALKAAFDANQLEIFAILKSYGMSFGSYQELAEYHYLLNSSPKTDSNKKQIFQFNRKFLKPALKVDPVTKILQKSRYIFDHRMYDEDQIDDILEAVYRKINETFPEVFKIVASSSGLEVIFDFLNTEIADLTYRTNLLGINDEFNNYIVIAARDLLSNETVKSNNALGTVGHEMMHCAMHLVYENYASPYDKNDHERIQAMLNVRRKCEEFKDVDPVIGDAFAYDETEINRELIARVPDILFTYRHNQTRVEELKITFHDLFTFYYNLTVPDMQEYMLTMDARDVVREVNSWLDLLDMIQADDYDDNQDDDASIVNVNDILHYLNGHNQPRLKVFTNSNAKSVLNQLYNELRKAKVIAVYMPISFSEQGNFPQVMSRIDELNTNIPLIIYCDDDGQILNFSKILRETTFKRIAVVKGTLDVYDANFGDKYEKSVEYEAIDILLVAGFLIIFITLTGISCIFFCRAKRLTADLYLQVRQDTVPSIERKLMF